MDMEYGRIENRIHIDASPEVVYEVVGSPEHIARWWFDEADFEPTPGRAGALAASTATSRTEVPTSVVEAVPGARFSFQWAAPPVTEAGMRELGWEAAVLEDHNSHGTVWARLLADLPAYVANLARR
jgi:uncharacterized protein YndB with AHSA1/START domain